MISFWKHLTIKIKLIIIGIMLLSVFASILLFYFIPVMEDSIKDKKKEKIRQITQTVHSAINYYHEQHRKGIFTLDEAQGQAIMLVKNIRYGPKNKDYLWINDFYPRMIMHPYKPELDGKKIDENKDPNGKRLFVEMVKVCRKNGNGYVEYMWQHWDDAENVVPKISYVKAFKPWNWIIGTGIYIEDVKEEIDKIKITMYGIIAGIFIIAIILMLLFVRSITSPLNRVVQFATDVSNGQLNTIIEQKHYVKCADVMDCDNDECPSYSTNDLACWRIKGTPADAEGHDARYEKCRKCKVYKKNIRNEIDMLIESINHMVQNTSGIINSIHSVADSIDTSVADLDRSVNDEATAINEQMATVEETTSTMEELNAIAAEIDSDSSRVLDLVNDTSSISRDSKRDLNELLEIISTISAKNDINTEEIQELSTKSNQINEILETIDGIANQTKLIAFNATIEAAGSGDLGRRFSIVAEEVRNLATSIMSATDEITNEIRGIQEGISRILHSSREETVAITKSVDSSRNTDAAFQEVLDKSEDSLKAIQNISEAIGQQKNATEQVLYAVRDTSASTQIISSNINSIAENIYMFKQLSEKLKSLISYFDLQ